MARCTFKAIKREKLCLADLKFMAMIKERIITPTHPDMVGIKPVYNAETVLETVYCSLEAKKPSLNAGDTVTADAITHLIHFKRNYISVSIDIKKHLVEVNGDNYRVFGVFDDANNDFLTLHCGFVGKKEIGANQ
jgi:hypothetical protein